jgi:putative endonuclease
MPWLFYIIECADTSLYCGITNNIKRRIEEHNNGLGGKYTRSRLPVRLKYSEEYPTRSEALKRESDVRRWSRKKKLILLRSACPRN